MGMAMGMAMGMGMGICIAIGIGIAIGIAIAIALVRFDTIMTCMYMTANSHPKHMHSHRTRVIYFGK